MPCYQPVRAFPSKKLGENGSRGIVFRQADGYWDKAFEVPCGTCLGCKLERAREWALRCVHESRLHPRNCFVTLTYDEAHLPKNLSLVPEDLVNFMKRLRIMHEDKQIRFFACGEYGELNARPHYHALLFNHDFDDRVHYSTRNGFAVYTSKVLDKLWGQGMCTVGDLSFQSAGYIARYTLKKVTGPEAAKHYGERVPEYLRMSRRPGIGKAFFGKFHREIFGSYRHPVDECVSNGSPAKPPRYYDKLLADSNPSLSLRIKVRRQKAAAESVDNSPRRLYERCEVKQAAVKSLRKGDP